ncbi:MAG: DUF4838 domain-containing protein [Bacteroidales bacterium]
MKHFLSSVFALFLFCSSFAQNIILVGKGKPKARIVLADTAASTNSAANLMRLYIKMSSGAELPIIRNKLSQKGDIVIGGVAPKSITEDGFEITTNKGVLSIKGKDKGVIYGVVTLLEQLLNADCLAANVYHVDKKKNIVVPEIYLEQNPAFRYRQSQGYGMHQDSIYKMWMRLEEPNEVFAGNHWVHTFNSLLPASEYGEKHPEFYSVINGIRRPGKASQWCLTNDQLFEIVAKKVDSIFKANPKQSLISISQNDSNHTYCRCEKCEKVNQSEESPVGNYIHFLNKLAERFPDKEFSTLAYLFTMSPPKHIKPLPNVNIMLCDIDCEREVPLTDNISGQAFVEAMKGWSAISNNIFVWDYGINFDNMVAPFPNFKILQPNIELFLKNNVVMHFSQIGGSYGGEFSELRTYVVSKLMWNPKQDVDSLIWQFMTRYYGESAKYLFSYLKMLEGGLLASNQRLWIYDSPVSHSNGMLNDKSRKYYNQLFDRAEQAVKSDSSLLNRVRMARLPLLYSELEIARTKTKKDIEEVKNTLNIFEKYVAKFGVKTLNERNNSPVEYCQLYRSRYLPSNKLNLAYGAKVVWEVEPTGRYKVVGETTLTDGLFGGASFTDSWTGWEGVDASFILDMGEIKSVQTIETDFLHQLGQWILLPKSVEYQISKDGKTYTHFGQVNFEEDQSVPVKFIPAIITHDKTSEVQFIKVSIEGTKICPSWHYGVGYPCWFFIDEISVW